MSSEEGKCDIAAPLTHLKVWLELAVLIDEFLDFFLYSQSFEALSERAVAVVVDPIQSVKGKVK